ncbi:hypothetical protein vst10_04 [Salmonella virus VSt10]|uniref:Uncharacterized protein n=1 Tax=Salmonella virus VSt10 TaxID=2301722 RepID=A0A385EGZ4_9CAUD|nr:hypothetical protein QA024_gp04 [Salmonella virus VSt10]AXQ70262.1 hypothetical protein vst10_04 [Salmonella virus VSt10]
MYAICQVVAEYDSDFDGDILRVVRVLQVFHDEESANIALDIFDPSRYGGDCTMIRVVSTSDLNTKFR